MLKIPHKRSFSFCNLRFRISNLFRISDFGFSASPQRGFTLIEMLIALAIFSIIMVISVGSLISLINANHKAQTLKTVVNNLHFALENMSRNIRTGTNYHCGGGDVRLPADCATVPQTQLAFKARDGNYMAYRIDQNGAIVRSRSSDYTQLFDSDNLIPVTAPEIKVEALSFYVDGASSGDAKQPRVLILGRVTMLGKGKVLSTATIETLVSQRLLDL